MGVKRHLEEFKERLMAIMNHHKKLRLVIVFSAVLVGTTIFGAVHRNLLGYQNTQRIAYNLAEIAKYKTPYMGDNTRVSAIVGQLPEPDSCFRQKYISMITDGTNKLNVFYEAKEGASYSHERPVADPENPTYLNMRKNALVLFCMIDNLNEVTFAFRTSPSDGKLDTSTYDTSFNFSRASVQKQYGNLSIIGGNLEKLRDALVGEKMNPAS